MDNLDFDKRVREIVGGHLEAPSANSWALIASGLQRRREMRLRRIRRSVYAYSAVAALLLFVVINPWFFSDKDDIRVNESLLSDSFMPKRIPEVSVIKDIKRPMAIADGRISAVKGSDNNLVLAEGKIEPAQEIAQREADRIATEIARAREVVKRAEEEAKRVEEETKKEEQNRVVEKRPENRVVRNVLSDPLFDDMVDKKIGGKPLLALSTGVSPSYAGSFTGPEMMASSFDGQNNVNPIYLRSEAPKEGVFEEEYMMPVTIGVQMLFPITDRFSVGTGINYSMLATKYYVTSMTTNSTERRRVTVHYMGVPLIFQYKIFSANKFKFYVTGSTTIEKGLAAVDKNLLDGTIIDEGDEIRGVQLSTAAGLGVEYGISNSLGLYFDPNITYYFDNKKKAQPFSIRTVQPLLFRFEAGLRIRL
jgi:hypothetical protein